MLCGQHALNNLVQECKFSVGSLATIAVRGQKTKTITKQTNLGDRIPSLLSLLLLSLLLYCFSTRRMDSPFGFVRDLVLFLLICILSLYLTTASIGSYGIGRYGTE